MKLQDLEPRWCSAGYWASADSPTGRMQMGASGRHGMGLSFLCPVHRDHRLVVMFANPIDGLPIDADTVRYRWLRAGETFETLTLGPSIDASGATHGNGAIETPCWHGYITEGEIR